jgi:hypothetical protein
VEGRAARIEALYRRALAEARRAYDPARHLIGQPGVGGTVYRPAMSLPLAEALLREGDTVGARSGAAEAAAIVAAVLDSQELDPEHPHHGNFLWLAGDAEVADLNAVQFVLRGLLPLLVKHADRLPGDLVARARAAVRAALQEEERLAVAPTYTNIHLQALFGLIVGGEWLDDAHFARVGRTRWGEWVRFTARDGAPHEYNSPGYGAIDLSALAALHGLVRDRLVALQARVMYERLWLHLALRYHVPTGQHAGPHCRCYWDAMASGRGGLQELLWRELGWPDLDPPPASLELALTEHWLPDVVRDWLEGQARHLPCEVRERTSGADLTTYMTAGYALGTASRTYRLGQDDFYIEHQANHLALHYRRRQGWAMVYSRYVVNDRHRGRLGAAPDRPATINFYDQGEFASVQARNRAIALYALERQPEEVHSLKTVVVFPPPESLDELWVDRAPVTPAELPRELPPGAWVAVGDGAVWVGVRVLAPSQLGRRAPTQLERGPEGELWLTAYNYRGPAKRFWEYASLGGAFWRGNLRAGFVIEVADRDAFPSAAAFVAHLAASEVEDSVDAEHVRRVTYRSGGAELAIAYDLWRTEPRGRWLNGRPYQPPSLDSPVAVQGDGGRLRLGDAVVTTEPTPIWLTSAGDGYAVVNPLDRPTPLRLETGRGRLDVERFGVGRLEWHGGDAVVDALDASGGEVGVREDAETPSP